MKLRLDENLSRPLVPALQAQFPGSSQVSLLELERATDVQLRNLLEASCQLHRAFADPATGVVVIT